MIRLSDTLKARATSYADGLGISLNALVSVALNDYLNARAVPVEVPSHSIDPVVSVAPMGVARVPVPRTGATGADDTSQPSPVVAPVPDGHDYGNTPRNAPCPCGSGRKFKLCHGKP